jgi:hypothetical protein
MKAAIQERGYEKFLLEVRNMSFAGTGKMVNLPTQVSNRDFIFGWAYTNCRIMRLTPNVSNRLNSDIICELNLIE